ncbi:MAG: HlyD family efflux transporter periplasmic adaptor subunit [Planctomycetes bacterium]|nr:HlyD family efflux transporter periplasmic adaptor subunit [Planctomycetota bacterium]MBL7042552.1 HlyD family efflux transporter periplasmic adaptor subunit [Pirellulaceae bacterium]
MKHATTTWLLLVLGAVCGRQTQSAEIEAFVRLIEQAETSAREAGVLTTVLAKEGQMVTEGEVLAQIEDVQARFDKKRAELELEIAREDSENDVAVRASQKAAAVAQNDWQRVQRTVDKNPNAISASEVEHRRLTAEQAELEVERAQRDLRIARVQRQVKENECQFAAEKLERHKVVAPLGGMVIEVHRRRGEWVEPGERVLRIVRIDRLRIEGFVDASQARSDWKGLPVTVTVEMNEDSTERFAGEVVFVSPEIDPVNGQVAIWAELENRDLLLRPGLRASMTIGAK